jgi:hypothetical protein
MTPRTLFAASAWLVSLCLPLSAAANDTLVVVVEAGPLRLDLDALREELGRVTDREVISPADPRAGASDLLVMAHAGGRRWVLRYQRGADVLQAVRETRPGTLRAVLVQASAELATRAVAQATAGAAPAAPEAPPAEVAAPCPVPEASWPPEQGADVMDPFVGWDPLRVALALSLLEPFDRAAVAPARWAWGTIVDPFADEGLAWADLMNPWSRP